MLQSGRELSYYDLEPVVDFLGAGVSKASQGIHVHNFCELHYCLSGSGYFEVDDRIYSLKMGDMLFCNPNEVHGYVGSKEHNLELFYVAFHNRYLQEKDINFSSRGGVERIVHTARNTQKKLNICYTEMLEEYSRQMPGGMELIRLNLVRMMILMMRETLQTILPEVNPSNNPLKIQQLKLVDDMLAYLNENYASKISLDQLAKNVFMSPSYICKLFKQEIGESPINYLIRLRMEKARELLLTQTSYSIKKIACLVGYEDIYQFSKLFKKYYGVAPSYYRNQG